MNPPSTLSDDDIRRVADVRRAVWTAGIQGGLAGVFLGSTSFLLLRRTGRLPASFKTSNDAMLLTLGSGALCSFLAALTAGKNNVHNIADVFKRGAHVWRKDDPLSKPHRTAYQQITDDNQQRDRDDITTPFMRRRMVLANNRATDDAASSYGFDDPPPRSF